MAWPRSAPEEILRRIKEISKEESELTKQAGNMRADLKRVESKREELATKRRQYEYALKTLDGEDVVHVPVVTTGGSRIIHVNSVTTP